MTVKPSGVGSNLGHGNCVLEQDALLVLLLLTWGYKWVPARVEVNMYGSLELYTPLGAEKD